MKNLEFLFIGLLGVALVLFSILHAYISGVIDLENPAHLVAASTMLTACAVFFIPCIFDNSDK